MRGSGFEKLSSGVVCIPMTCLASPCESREISVSDKVIISLNLPQLTLNSNPSRDLLEGLKRFRLWGLGPLFLLSAVVS